MAFPRFSIRNQLLLLAALATGSIWAGALVQYLNLREETQLLASVRVDLASADRMAELARAAAQERGLSNGWLLRKTGAQQASTNPAELSDARSKVDAALRLLQADLASGNETAVLSRSAELARYRGQIDRRELAAPAAFAFYSGLVAAVQDSGARRLRGGMVQVGLSYEHVNDLRRAAELLASVRGLTHGVLSAGSLSADAEQALSRQLTLHKEFLHQYEQSVPATVQATFAAQVSAAAVRSTTELASRLLVLKQPDALDLDAPAWWTLATEAVDGLQLSAAQQAAVLSQAAEQRMRATERQLWITVAVLVALGIVSLGMVLATVGRIVRGIDRLLVGLEGVGSRRNFNARIDDSRSDEFGVISSGVNKLMAIVGQAMDEQEQLTLTDPLTGVLNRRGFDAQLAARTHLGRAHATVLCVVMVDVDHFKKVNDTYGHASGDAVLRQLSSVLKQNLRPDDVLARFGGEEFIALLTGCDLAGALTVAEKLRAAVAAQQYAHGQPITASFGVAAWREGQPTQELIENADANLYLAKQAGRNRVMPGQLSLAA